MSPDDPRHGTNAGAVAHWRAGQRPCPPCSAARSRLSKGAALDRARGNHRTVTLGDHAHRVILDVPADQLATITGLSVHKLSRLRKSGPTAVVHRRTRDRILIASRAEHWTPIGLQRRVQALAAIGWSVRAQAAASAVGYEALKRLARGGERGFVRREIAEPVTRMYDALAMKPAPPGSGRSRALTEAARHGWAPPLAWDDIDHDRHPSAAVPAAHPEPDPVVVQRILGGARMPATRAEKLEVLASWQAAGKSLAALEQQTNWNVHRDLRSAS